MTSGNLTPFMAINMVQRDTLIILFIMIGSKIKKQMNKKNDKY